ncbi:hypothetical protein M153_5140002777 [Pseudoloma neurophilia]|uniref:Uncharacterized protein n=1 Tax=Pseudoloma neurophilia TaxID=146866 RepID=A0A0R0LXJ5_9MICR|nr:hypothetical protein M153_5140002777 [Pseudoloma neurophilia]
MMHQKITYNSKSYNLFYAYRPNSRDLDVSLIKPEKCRRIALIGDLNLVEDTLLNKKAAEKIDNLGLTFKSQHKITMKALAGYESNPDIVCSNFEVKSHVDFVNNIEHAALTVIFDMKYFKHFKKTMKIDPSKSYDTDASIEKIASNPTDMISPSFHATNLVENRMIQKQLPLITNVQKNPPIPAKLLKRTKRLNLQHLSNFIIFVKGISLKKSATLVPTSLLTMQKSLP